MITVFTPAYNRAGTLPRLYESLLAQTCTDFEWLVIDDGSTDETADVVKDFIDNGKFSVRYLYKENGGKHTAHNLALQEAEGEYFWCVDSDDLLAPDAIEAVKKAFCQAEAATVLCSYKSDLQGNLLSAAFPEIKETAGLLELNQKYGCTGEFALTFLTEFVRRYPFPVFSGERFVTESVIYDRMETRGKMVLLPKVTNLCEYQPEGYSRSINQVMKNNPCGYCLYYSQRVDLVDSFYKRLMMASKYRCFRWICHGKSPKYNGPHKLTVFLSAPVGMLFRVYYKWVRGF